MNDSPLDDRQAAATLVLILHRSMDWDLWGKKRLKYWDIYENAVTSAARTTNSLTRWLNSVCSRMSITAPGRNDADRQQLNALLNAGRDAAVLKVMRNEPQIVILLVRTHQEDKKAAARAERAETATWEDFDA